MPIRRGLRNGERRAVADVSFAVGPGEIFGVIGPNGAGKTTTVGCVSGLRRIRPAGDVVERRLLGSMRTVARTP